MDRDFRQVMIEQHWVEPSQAIRSKMNTEFAAINSIFRRNLARELSGGKLVWRKPRHAGADIYSASCALFDDLLTVSNKEHESIIISVLVCHNNLINLFDTLDAIGQIRKPKVFMCAYGPLSRHIERVVTGICKKRPEALAAIERHSVKMSIKYTDEFARYNCPVNEAAVNVWATLVSERIARFIMEELKRNLV
jgi:hypothetical protein